MKKILFLIAITNIALASSVTQANIFNYKIPQPKLITNDWDGDGQSNDVDTDDDNDGILDTNDDNPFSGRPNSGGDNTFSGRPNLGGNNVVNSNALNFYNNKWGLKTGNSWLYFVGMPNNNNIDYYRDTSYIKTSGNYGYFTEKRTVESNNSYSNYYIDEFLFDDFNQLRFSFKTSENGRRVTSGFSNFKGIKIDGTLYNDFICNTNLDVHCGNNGISIRMPDDTYYNDEINKEISIEFIFE